MKIKLLAIIFLSLIAGTVRAQEAKLADFVKRLETYSSKYAQEKVYLHLDKPYYAVGDNIWFKAYTVNAKTGTPSLTSGIVYVELIDEKDFVKKQLKLSMRSGITWGDFKLTDSLKEGNYRVRAYTQWMRNAGPEFFFDKTIKIGNSWANKVFTKSENLLATENNLPKITSTIQFTDKQNLPYTNRPVKYEVKLGDKIISSGKGVTNSSGEIVVNVVSKQLEGLKSGFILATLTLPNGSIVDKEIPLKSTVKNVDVQFFPEGGTLIDDLPNKLGVKAVNADGLGELVKGVIVNSSGEEVSNFETNHLGMGSFFLNPTANEVYRAKVSFADGSQKTLNLPPGVKTGRVLSVNNTDSLKMSVKLYLSSDLLNKEDYFLIAQHNGAVYFSAKITSTKQVTSITVAKDSLPSGIIQISLLSSDFVPLNERIVFVNNVGDKINIKQENLKAIYAPRTKMDFNVLATHLNEPVKGSFSVAVTNTTAVRPDIENETNILTKLLLTSDLVGYVEKPNYYFINNNKVSRQHLDDLLLTQGWRKINWTRVNSAETPSVTFQPEKKMQISGTVTKGGKPVVGGNIMLVSFTGGFFATDTLTDDKGRFNFDKIEFLDSTKFVVQARTAKERKFVDIVMDVVPGQIVNKNPNSGDIEVNVNQSLAGYLAQSGKYFDDQSKRGLLNRTILLDEVNIVGMKKPTYETSNLNGAGNADAVFKASDMENEMSLSSFLQGRVAGIQILNGQAYSRGSQDSMMVMVDGMSVGGEGFSLDDVVVNDIETIEILKSAANTAIYGMQGGAGVILITTKRGTGFRQGNTYTPGLINYNPKGLSLVREFYSPKYDVTPDSRPDFRTTVFWEPQLVTDNSGKANLKYFNTDVPGVYRVVIEGIDINGSLARQVFTYEVK